MVLRNNSRRSGLKNPVVTPIQDFIQSMQGKRGGQRFNRGPVGQSSDIMEKFAPLLSSLRGGSLTNRGVPNLSGLGSDLRESLRGKPGPVSLFGDERGKPSREGLWGDRNARSQRTRIGFRPNSMAEASRKWSESVRGIGDFGDLGDWFGDATGISLEGLNFSVKGNAANARGMEGALKHRKLAERASKESGVPTALILAVMGLESGGRNNLTSPAGARGLMQIMPNYWQSTANRFGGNLMDPWTNIRTGAEILKQKRNQWGSWENAVKAYLAGTPHSTARDAFGTTVNTYAQIIANNLAWLQQRGIGNQQGGAVSGPGGQGTAVWNIFGGDRLTVTQRYGNTSFAQSSGFYANNFHDGVDISVRSGTALRAPVNGVVEFVGNKGGYGGTVQIRTSSGHVIKLSHMRSFNVRQGQRVTAGTVLGQSGGGANDPMRGTSTGAHLHLTVYRPNGQHMDPMQFFRF